MRREAIAENLTPLKRVPASPDGLIRAAVAVCLVVDDGDPAMVITRRAPRCVRTPVSGHCRVDAVTTTSRPSWPRGGNCSRRPGWRRPNPMCRRARRLRDPLRVRDDAGGGVGRPGRPALRGAESEVAAVHLSRLRFDVEPRLISIAESDRPVIQLPLFGAMYTRRRQPSSTSSARWGCTETQSGWPTTSSRCSPGSSASRARPGRRAGPAAAAAG